MAFPAATTAVESQQHLKRIAGAAGLGGELRAVSRLEPRLIEASKLGFTSCVIPKGGPALSEKRLQGMKLIPCANIDQALRAAIGGRG